MRDLLLTAKGRREQCDESLKLFDVPLLSLVLEVQLFEDAGDATRPLLLVLLTNIHHELVLDSAERLLIRIYFPILWLRDLRAHSSTKVRRL